MDQAPALLRSYMHLFVYTMKISFLLAACPRKLIMQVQNGLHGLYATSRDLLLHNVSKALSCDVIQSLDAQHAFTEFVHAWQLAPFKQNSATHARIRGQVLRSYLQRCMLYYFRCSCPWSAADPQRSLCHGLRSGGPPTERHLRLSGGAGPCRAHHAEADGILLAPSGCGAASDAARQCC